MNNIDGDVVILGDTHLGKGKFNTTLLESQLSFFEEQLFPYMLENGIDTIIQLGDFFDNRRIVDIAFLNTIKKRVFDKMLQYNFKMIEILGNHDIYYKNTREVNLISIFELMYQDNLTVIYNREYCTLNDKRIMFVPWLTDDESLTTKELNNVELLFGHFEIQSFEMVRGHVDETSNLSLGFFNQVDSLKKVFSGHYHLKSNKGKVMYCGTPYQLDWGDYLDLKSFYVLKKDGEFNEIKNDISKKYVKIKYNTDKEHKIEINGLGETIYVSDVNNIDIENLKKHNLKFFINATDDTSYHEEVIFTLREKGCEFKVTNNVEIADLIGINYVEDDKEVNVSTNELILKTVGSEAPELMDLVSEMLNDIKNEE